jgi:hypothetical protein
MEMDKDYKMVALVKLILYSTFRLILNNVSCYKAMVNYDWVMQNTSPSDLAKCELSPYSSGIYSWLSNEPLCIKI